MFEAGSGRRCRGVGTTAIVALLGVSIASRASAQDVSALRERLNETQSLWHEATLAAEFAAAPQPPVLGLDTTCAGEFCVSYDRTVAGTMEPAVAAAGTEIAHALGRSASLLHGFVFHVTLDSRGDEDVLDARIRAFGIDRSYTFWDEELAEVPSILSRELVSAVDQHLNALVPEAFREWVRAMYVSSASMRRDDADLYRQLVTAPYVVTRDCLAGDVTRCRLALGIDPTQDPLTEWLSERDRQRWVAREPRADTRWSPDAALEHARCLEHDDAGSCIAALRHRLGGIPAPLGLLHRRRVADVAFHLGGDGAVERLVNAHGSVSELLQAAAGVEVDSIVRTWRSELRASAGRPVRVTTINAFGSIAWTLVCLVAALRSTRWR
jgi:hypothetical protein